MREVWNKALNDYQREATTQFVNKKTDLFINLPTGYGKSLVYQALPLVFDTVHGTVGHIVVVRPGRQTKETRDFCCILILVCHCNRRGLCYWTVVSEIFIRYSIHCRLPILHLYMCEADYILVFISSRLPTILYFANSHSKIYKIIQFWENH